MEDGWGINIFLIFVESILEKFCLGMHCLLLNFWFFTDPGNSVVSDVKRSRTKTFDDFDQEENA